MCCPRAANKSMTSSYRLSSILSAALVGALLLVSGAFMIISYFTAHKTFEHEVDRMFDYRNRVIEISLRDNLSRIHTAVTDVVAHIELLGSAGNPTSKDTFEEHLGELLLSESGSRIDILAIRDTENRIQSNLSSPLSADDDTQLQQLFNSVQDTGAWNLAHIQSGDKKLFTLVRTEPLIDHVHGRVIASLIYGITISDNLTLANRLRQDAGVVGLQLLVGEVMVAEAGITRREEGRKVGYDLVQKEKGIRVPGHSGEIRVRSFLEATILQDLNAAYRHNLTLLALITLVSGILFLVFVRKLTDIGFRPLITYADEASTGTDIQRFRAGFIREFNTLGHNIEVMVNRVRANEEQVRLLLNSTAEAIFGMDRDGLCTFANPTCARLLGYDDADELLGQHMHTLSHHTRKDGTPYPAHECKILHATISGQGDHSAEDVFWRRDGSSFPVEYWSYPVIDEDKLVGTVVSFLDITDRLQAEKEIRDLRNYLSNIIDSMPSILVGIDTDGRVTQWNREARSATGIEAQEAYGKALGEVLPHLSIEMERIQRAIEQRRIEHDQRMVGKRDGETRYSDVTIYPLVANGVKGAVIRVDDITERVRIEEMMVQSEKMLSVGGLAAGMAHEINNPLAGILQNMQVFKNRTDPGLPRNREVAAELGIEMESIRSYMEKRNLLTVIDLVTESGLRAAKVVENMLSFSRKGDSEFMFTDIPGLIEKTLELAASDYDLKKNFDFRKIGLIREFDDHLPKVPCEPSKIQQVILNLLKNGAYAMAEGTGGDRPPHFIIRIKKEPKDCRIEIEDNGPGMDESIRRRVFEPFFTTKGSGVGTGLGLSVSYFIICENHNGTMSVESTPCAGSRFIITLPLEQTAAFH